MIGRIKRKGEATGAEKRRAEATVVRTQEKTLRVELRGTWRVSSLRPAVEEVVAQVASAPEAHRVTFLAEGVEDWDSILPAFLLKARSGIEQAGMEVEFSGLPGGVTRLLALAAAVPKHEAPPPPAKERFPFLALLGERTLSMGQSFAEALNFTGPVTSALGRLFQGRAWFRTSDLLFQIQECGHRALPIAMLISFLVGLILAFVGAVQLAQFGAEIFVASLVGIAMVRAMGAVMTGIIMAGRNGAAFAAELGTMQVNEETDALRTLGIPPVEFLVLPRLLAMALMMPLLCIFADLVGTAGGFTGKRTDTETFFRYTSYTDPGSIYRLDLETGACTLFRRSPLHFDPADYVTERVFYRSKDGTRVPLFLSYKKGLERNGRSPTLLYGYGGFDIAITPHFSVANLVWMEMGGLYAVACIRGGGEYGEAWHEAGMKHKKQNGFDDFIAAAEWLIREQYTSTPRLAIAGGSNGGLLVGACMVQRPDLFGACLPAVGVMDMLRFHKFTIGWAWVSDYGSPDDPEDFKYLYAYSPYHNIEDGVSYPATLILTADHDDRVVPGHSFKFAARLQAAQGGDAPILIRIQRKAGHGGGKPTAMRIEEAADRLAFLVKVLHMEE